ncbi:MAG TPA: alkaline phosphatase family protein [Jatrophihabitantaceae bacterium]|nr:alkaline phosphatase family protein [Jatrophihabitantaceae bacterium]
MKHVWIIMLENENYSDTFGAPAADPYLARTLRGKGVLLTKYYGIGHDSLDNYIALASGQPPNTDTQHDCHTFSAFIGSTNHHGIETRAGCVYPADIQNIGTQLVTNGLRWKEYAEGMGNIPSREAAACGHPVVNGPDGTQAAVKGDGYATRHNPFVYFRNVIDHKTYCNRHVVALGTPHGAMPSTAVPGETGLATDLKSLKSTPSLSFITPDLCSDGHDYPCKNRGGKGSAAADIDAFLKTWVPKIRASAAYKDGGLIEITFDESDGPKSDSTACCGETAGPNAPMPGITGPGGGRVGALLISPFIKAGTRSTVAYNHYSMLAANEKLFGLPLLGEARTVTSTFGHDVFTAYSK